MLVDLSTYRHFRVSSPDASFRSIEEPLTLRSTVNLPVEVEGYLRSASRRPFTSFLSSQNKSYISLTTDRPSIDRKISIQL